MKRKHDRPDAALVAVRITGEGTIELLKKTLWTTMYFLLCMAFVVEFSACTTWPGNSKEYQASFLYVQPEPRTAPDGGKHNWVMVGPNGGLRF